MAEELQFLDYEGLTTFKGNLNDVDIVTTAGDGNDYTATIPGVTELKVGMAFTIIPHVTSTKTLPTLNLNELGAKTIRRRISNSTVSTTSGSSAGWMAANKPLRVTYDGTWWIADFDRPNAADLYGTVSLEKGGTGATDAAGARVNLEAQKQHTGVTVDLPVSGWANKTQTVNVTGVTADNTVVVSSAPANYVEYGECIVRASAQGDGTLTFVCDDVPSTDLQANVIILDEGGNGT